jgi:orotate phosphoribosyltransferase
MIFDKETAYKTAELLLQIKAIQLNPETPFTWASGMRSPIYCDNRLALSFPAVRNYLRQEFVRKIEQHFGTPEVIAGVATGAIGLGILVAESMGLPFVYVRPEPKSHGRMNQIEGLLQKGQNVVVIEDLISTGKSSFKAVEALEAAGANIKGMAAIFTYNFEMADQLFETNDLKLITLSDYNHLIQFAQSNEIITEEQLGLLAEWRANPNDWNPSMN